MNNIDDKSELILVQWQTCVEMANSVSQRRDTMNNTFITLNLAIVTAVSTIRGLNSLIILIAGVVTCFIWIIFIRNYRILNEEKFKVINEIEQLLPVKPFVKEWEGLKANEKYMDGTTLERILPVSFTIIYVVVMIVRLYYN